jgi:uncharacterized protein YbbC (DUF1343 family)
MQNGIDVLAVSRFAELKGRRVGAIVNPTSVDRTFKHLADLLIEHEVKVGALFGPEHGVRGEAQYMVPVDGVARDRRTGLKVYSLYGNTFESLTPKQEWLDGLDALVFDIQDVGSRYYTYVYTMLLSMRAAAEAGIEFWVLDRPNPIGGLDLEGNLVGDRYKSFVGLWALPNRHGMTAGELARLFKAGEKMDLELHVVECSGWSRGQHFDETGLHFVPPSPNMPTPDTARVYPGMCLLEGTNVSEGRGTCRPFEQFGAPWLDAQLVTSKLEAMKLPGVRFRSAAFTPTFDKHKGQSCEGSFIHVTDRRSFRPLLTAIAIVKVCHDLAGGFEWRKDAYEFVDQIPAFDLLCGTDRVRLGIEDGWPLERLTEGFDAQLKAFVPKRAEHLLYR